MIFAGYNFKAFFYYQLLEAYRFSISLLLLLWKKAFNISQLHCLDKNQSQVICEHLKAFFPLSSGLVFWCKYDISNSGAADDLLYPVGEPGDASVDTIVVWTPAASTPAHHPGQEPATWRLLTHQGTARVSLTDKGNVNEAQIRLGLHSTEAP